MTINEYCRKLSFHSFEKYPEQNTDIYIKCDGMDMGTREYVYKFIRVNKFNAATFDPKEVKKILNNNDVDWNFSWLPADEIDENYDKGNNTKCGTDRRGTETDELAD